MLKRIATTSLLLFYGCSALLSQDIDRDRRELLTGLSYFNVVNNSHPFWEGERNHGIGLFAEYRFPLIKKWKINAHLATGVDKLVDCNICKSEWFNESVWLGAGLGTFFTIGQQHTFSAQVRARLVGFQQLNYTAFDMNGNLIDLGYDETIDSVLGLKLGYHLPVALPLEFSYTFEKQASLTNINTFSLAWSISLATKSRVKRTK